MSTTLPNMSLLVPDSGDSDYPTSISTSLSNIDDHDHTSGNGVQVPTGGIADLAVTSAKLAASAVTSGKVAASSADGSTIEVSSGAYRIKDAGVTKAKLAALGQQTATLGALVSFSSTSQADVSGLSVSITTTGRPVMLALYGADITVDPADSAANSTVFFVRGATTLATHLIDPKPSGGNGMRLAASMLYIDAPAAGTYTYKIQAQKSAFSGNIVFNQDLKLTAYEL